MPNAKRNVYTMPYLRQQNKGADTGGYRAKEFSHYSALNATSRP